MATTTWRAAKWELVVASNERERGCSRQLVTTAIWYSGESSSGWRNVMSKPQHIQERRQSWGMGGYWEEKGEQRGKQKEKDILQPLCLFSPKIRNKEVVLNDFYSFASASLLFISLLFSLSPTAGRCSGLFSEVVFLEPLSAALCLSLDFFTGLLWPAAAAAPGLLGLERGALYLST